MHPEAIAVVDPCATARLYLYAEQLHAAWREAREESACAYRQWSEAPRGERRLAFAVFLAAADREAAAERGFCTAIGRER